VRRRPSSGRRPAAEIEHHGVIGDLHTAALVDPQGTIDWLCLPHFDSPSVFGSLLDQRKGGQFAIRPQGEVRTRQSYRPGTAILVTRFYGEDATAELVDFMPVGGDEGHRLLRILRVLRGTMEFAVTCAPRPEYGSVPVAAKRRGAVEFGQGSGMLRLFSTKPMEVADGIATAKVELSAGDDPLILEFTDADRPSDAEEQLEATTSYWTDWLKGCTYRGRWRETVERSALTLKLLTFEPSGAMVAAVTTSLPARPGTERNWDYRYTWLRDSSFVLYALLRIGFKHEAKRFMDWLRARFAEGPALHPMYSIDGRPVPRERELDWEGYLGSRPVRVGNGARDHLQLDLYGAVLDAVYLFNKYGMPISSDLWVDVRRLLEWLEDHWDEPDQSIWESRGPPQRFTFSRMMAWVAFDRGIRLAERRSLPAPIERWRTVRDEIHAWVLANGWDPARHAFVQAPGSDTLDASLLLAQLTFFASPMDRTAQQTLGAIQRHLGPDGLVRRMEGESPAGAAGRDGAFTVCSFWQVEALTRQGRLQEAREAFEVLLSHASPLGLYAEQVGDFGLQRGNFPQALTHLALISAAFNLDRALDEGAHRSKGKASGTAWRAFVEAEAHD
jgi:GH15 family glucan-1,4-alpha-glucosidase